MYLNVAEKVEKKVKNRQNGEIFANYITLTLEILEIFSGYNSAIEHNFI